MMKIEAKLKGCLVPCRIRPEAVVLLMACMALECCPRCLAAVSPQITEVGLAGARINLSWNGTLGGCDIQSAAGPSSPAWSTILHTSRTNAFVPLTGTSGFFRVVASDPTNTSLVLVTTNLSSGDVFTLTRLPQTNGDLVLDNLADTNAAIPVREAFPVAELQKFDIAFDAAGGFTIVTTNGNPGGSGGVMNSVPGPGPNQTTFSGFLTNGSDMVLFSSVAGPAPAKPGIRPLDTGTGSAAGAGDTGSASFSAVWCASAWAGQNLGCQADAASRTLGCVGFFPPKLSGGYGYITNQVGVTLTATNIMGSCNSHCVTCCKDLVTGALSGCTP